MNNVRALHLFTGLLTGFCGIAIIVGVVWRFGFRDTYFALFPMIPFLYAVMGGVMLCTFKRNEPNMRLILIFRGVKFVLTLLLLLLFVGFSPSWVKSACIAVGGFYFLYLLMETIFLMCYERGKKVEILNGGREV